MRLVTLGDSITCPSNPCGAGWPTFLTIPLAHNAAVGGQWTGQMVERVSSDVLAYDPTDVAILAGTNDVGAAVPLATTLANLASIADQIVAFGAVPWLLTVPPQTGYGNPADTLALNAALPALAAEHGARFVDIWPLLAGPTGAPLPGCSCDNIHPTAPAAAVIAFAVQQALQPSDVLIPFLAPDYGAAPDYHCIAACNPAFGQTDLVVDFIAFGTLVFDVNNAANYWHPYIATMHGAGLSETIAAADTHLDPVNAYRPHIVPVGTVLSRAVPMLGLVIYRTGAPGTLRHAATMYCRRG